MNIRAPFKTLLAHVQTESAAALNALDLPLGHANVPVPPKFHDLASEAYCANSARELVHVKDLSESTSWATAATTNALSWCHADDEGFGTSVYVQAGHKIWVVARRRDRVAGRDEMADVRVFDGWSVDTLDPKIWEVEAVYLDGRCVLCVLFHPCSQHHSLSNILPSYMRPCTMHCVLGTDNTIVLGRHFYATGTIQRTCFGIVHAFVMGSFITNTFHVDDTRSLPRQMLGAWYRHLVLHDGFESEYLVFTSSSSLMQGAEPSPHVPNMLTHCGVFDVINLGCIVELNAALDRARYKSDYREDDEKKLRDLEQESQSRTFFRVIMKTFASKYFLKVGPTVEHPTLIWQSHLVKFAVVVLGYMKAKFNIVRKEPGLTPEALETRLRLHFQTDHPHLLPAFNAAITDIPAPRELDWAGPPVRVLRRTNVSMPLLRASGSGERRKGFHWPLHRSDDQLNQAPVDAFYEGAWPHDDSDDDE